MSNNYFMDYNIIILLFDGMRYLFIFIILLVIFLFVSDKIIIRKIIKENFVPYHSNYVDIMYP